MLTAAVHGSGMPLIVMVCLVLVAGMVVFVADDIISHLPEKPRDEIDGRDR